MSDQDFVTSLEQWLSRHKLSQKEAAILLECSPEHLNRVLKGKANAGYKLQNQFDEIKMHTDPRSFFSSDSLEPDPSSPRGKLRLVMKRREMGTVDLAREMGYKIGPVDNIVNGSGRITENMAQNIVKVLPELELDDLLDGSDLPTRVFEDSGARASYGQKPRVNVIDGNPGKARYVPLISWAQAGTMSEWDDQAYDYDAQLTFGVDDPRAFALELRGDSMQPAYGEGDTVVLAPSFPTKNGDLVVCKLNEDNGGDVMFKNFTLRPGGVVQLTSMNPMYPKLEYHYEDFAWIYPVVGCYKNFRR